MSAKKPRMTPDERLAAAHAMRELMEAQDITVREAGMALGFTERHGSKIAAVLGLKATPNAIRKSRLKGLSAITPEQAQAGRARSAAALAEYRERKRAASVERKRAIADMTLTQTRAEVAERLGISMDAVKDALRERGVRRKPGPQSSKWKAELAARRAARAEIAESLRAYIAQHRCTVSEASRALEIGEGRGRSIAEEFGIKAPREVVMARAVSSGRKGAARKFKRAPEPIKASVPNPKLSAAQQAHVDRFRASGRALFAPSSVYVPPPPNAEQLIAEAIAAGRVTKCPPRFALPVNNGEGL